MSLRKIILVADNIRSSHNVGSLMRTADGLGIEKFYLCGITPYPEIENDTRPPHIRQRVTRQIQKTALGAEKSVAWQYEDDTASLLKTLAKGGYFLAALEQTDDAAELAGFRPPDNIVLLVGNELSGVQPNLLQICDISIRIAMHGQKESFNVAVAGAMALYQLKVA